MTAFIPEFIILTEDKLHNGEVFYEGRQGLTEAEAHEAVRDWQGMGWTVRKLLQEQPDGSYKPVYFEEMTAEDIEVGEINELRLERHAAQ